MRYGACTIVDAEHLHMAATVWQTLTAFRPVDFTVLVVDRRPRDPADLRKRLSRVACDARVITTQDLPEQERVIATIRNNPIMDRCRWALKPALLQYMLGMHEKALFLDPDLYFVSDWGFLWTYLDKAGMLLTPHWRTLVPSSEPDPTHVRNRWFLAHMTDGIFNGGFVGASRKGLPVIEWWRIPCEWRISNEKHLGLFWDQKYLDHAPINFPDLVMVLRHRGCNVAAWNDRLYDCVTLDGRVMVVHNKVAYPLVFMHGYNHSTLSPHPQIRAYTDAHKAMLAEMERAIYPEREESRDG